MSKKNGSPPAKLRTVRIKDSLWNSWRMIAKMKNITITKLIKEGTTEKANKLIRGEE